MSPFIILTGVSTCLKAWILWLGKRRKVLAEFRWFFLYIGYAFVESIARVGVSNNRKLYFYVYWATEALALTLLATAVGESFFRTLRPFTVFRGVRSAFWVCVATPVLYSVTRSIVDPPAQSVLWEQIIIGVEITLHYLVTAMMLLYLGLVWLFNIRDHRYEWGIVLGFGFNSSISALGYLLRSIFGTKLMFLSSGLPPLAFVIAEGLWVATFMKPPVPVEEGPAVSLTADEILRLLDEHVDVLRSLFRKRSV